MSFYLINVARSENDYNTGIPIIYGHFECDSVTDLPAQNQTTYKIGIGSTAHIIDTNAEYAITSGGTWYVQTAGIDVYTKAQTDALLLTKANAADVYTKTQTDSLLSSKANASDVYTKTQTDNLLSSKITLSDVFGMSNNPYIPEEDYINLNDYYTQGLYIKQFSAHVSTFINTPFDGNTFPYTAFKLKVEYINSVNNICQTLIPLNDNCTFFKRFRMTGANGTWRTWRYFEGVTV